METILQAIVSVVLILGALALLTYSFIVNAQTKRAFAKMTLSYQQLDVTLEQLTCTVKSVDFVAIEAALVERGLITEKVDSVQSAQPAPRLAYEETRAYLRKFIMDSTVVIALEADLLRALHARDFCSLHLTPNRRSRQTERIYRMLLNQAMHGVPMIYSQLEDLQGPDSDWRFEEDEYYELETMTGGPGFGGSYRGSIYAPA